MAKTRMQPQANPNAEIKLAVAKWKIQTGRSQYELAEMLGIAPSSLSRMLAGGRPGKTYVRRIYELINPKKAS